MNIVCIDPQSDPLWQEVINQHESDIFHSPQWFRVLADTYDFDIRAQVVVNGTDVPKGGMVYCKVEDMMGPRILSLPFSDFCDPLISGQEEWNCLANTFLAEHCPISFRCVHNDLPVRDNRLPIVGEDKWHCVDLQPDLETIWDDLNGAARRAIRKAQRAGVVVRIAQSKEDLRAFFELHLGVRKYKFGLLAQPYHFFESIWERFIEANNGALMLATYQDQVIGGIMFLEWNNRLYYKFNASHPDYISHRPNDLLLWEGLQYGKSKNFTYLDFGISETEHEGLVRYKRKFATTEKTIYSVRYKPEGQPTQKENQMRQLLPQLTDLFTDSATPDMVTEKAGDVLYRYFT